MQSIAVVSAILMRVRRLRCERTLTIVPLLPSGLVPGTAANRYERQIRYPGWGETGQSKLAAAHVAIVGCGALGTLQAEALARAGAGHITLIDRDFVEVSNLHRQFLFTERDAAEEMPKAVAAERRLREINSEIMIDSAIADLESGNARELLNARI